MNVIEKILENPPVLCRAMIPCEPYKALYYDGLYRTFTEREETDDEFRTRLLQYAKENAK